MHALALDMFIVMCYDSKCSSQFYYLSYVILVTTLAVLYIAFQPLVGYSVLLILCLLKGIC